MVNLNPNFKESAFFPVMFLQKPLLKIMYIMFMYYVNQCCFLHLLLTVVMLRYGHSVEDKTIPTFDLIVLVVFSSLSNCHDGFFLLMQT